MKTVMSAIEELQSRNIVHCPECHCAVGDDWRYKDFSNKNIIVCPQCGTEIHCISTSLRNVKDLVA